MSRNAYTQTNLADFELLGDSISHPPEEEDLCKFLFVPSPPQRNRIGAETSVMPHPNPDREDFFGCFTCDVPHSSQTPSES